MDNILIWIAENLTDTMYLKLLKIQGILWSIGDSILIYYFLKTLDAVRRKNNKRRIIIRYVIFWVTVVMILFLLFSRDTDRFWLIAFRLVGIQIAIGIGSVFMDGKLLYYTWRKMVYTG